MTGPRRKRASRARGGQAAARKPIRVLIAEDSPTVRELLVAILDDEDELELVGVARDGFEAVQLTRRLRPDVVTMDIRMPRMDGYEATSRIMTECPTPIVIVSGHVDVTEVGVSFRALRAGALTLLRKPQGPASPDFEESSRQLVRTVKAMADVSVVRRFARSEPAEPEAAQRPHLTFAPQSAALIAIAASTGGPKALYRLLSGLPAELSAPVLIVQHIAPGFVTGLVKFLDSGTPLSVKVAEQGERALPGTVYVASDGLHLEVGPGSTINLSNSDPVGGFRPSGTVLFESAASVFGKAVVAVMLTGMGRDGVDGLRTIRRGGGYIIAQDESSSAVFGMPAAAQQAGLAHAVLPLEEIAPTILRLVRETTDLKRHLGATSRSR